jgi:hypothetical protein
VRNQRPQQYHKEERTKGEGAESNDRRARIQEVNFFYFKSFGFEGKA